MRYREVASAVAETEEPKHEESRFPICYRCSHPSLSSRLRVFASLYETPDPSESEVHLLGSKLFVPVIRFA